MAAVPTLLVEIIKLVVSALVAVLAWRVAGNIASNVFEGVLDLTGVDGGLLA